MLNFDVQLLSFFSEKTSERDRSNMSVIDLRLASVRVRLSLFIAVFPVLFLYCIDFKSGAALTP